MGQYELVMPWYAEIWYNDNWGSSFWEIPELLSTDCLKTKIKPITHQSLANLENRTKTKSKVTAWLLSTLNKKTAQYNRDLNLL